MAFVFFDSIREFIPPDYTAWLQETILPLPLEGVLVSDISPARQLVSTTSHDYSHSYDHCVYDEHRNLIKEVSYQYGIHSEVKTFVPDQYEIWTSIIYIRDLKKDLIRTAIISDKMLACIIALDGIRNSLVFNMGQGPAIIQTLVLNIDYALTVLGINDDTMQIMQNIFGGTWTVLDKLESQNLQSLSLTNPMGPNHMPKPNWEIMTPSLFLPKLGTMITIKDSEFINDLYAKWMNPDGE